MSQPVLLPFVNVFVWPGLSSLRMSSDGIHSNRYSPGHVALETHIAGVSKYISFWPPDCPWPACRRMGRSHFHSKEEDAQAEQNAEGVILPKIYKLSLGSVEAINLAFEKFQRLDAYKWTALGSSFFRQAYERNCAGLALYLLEKGGIRELVSGSETTSYSRKMIAASISALFFVSINFLVAPPLWQLFRNFKALNRFKESYTRELDAHFLSLTPFDNIYKLARGIAKKLPSPDASVNEIIAKVEAIRTKIIEAAPLQYGLYVNFLHDLRRSKRHFVIGAASIILAPALLAITLIYLNQRIWLKTVLPADVERVAAKAEKALPCQASKGSGKKVFISVAALLAASFLLRRSIKLKL